MATTISANGATSLTSTTADDTVTFSVSGQAIVICRGSGQGGGTGNPGTGGSGGQSTTKAYLVAAGDVFHYKIPAGGATNTVGSLTAFGGIDSTASQYAGGGGDGTAGKGDSIRAGGLGGAAYAGGGGGGGGGGTGAGDVAAGLDGLAGDPLNGGSAVTAPSGGGDGGAGGRSTAVNATVGSQPGGGGGGKGNLTTAAAGGAGSISITFRANETMPIGPVSKTVIRPCIRSLIN